MKSSFVLPLAILGVAGNASIAMAQASGTFTATGNMTTERMFHTATLLPNGKVLIAGGFAIRSSGFPDWATAELYDPATGTFTPTGSMTTARSFHTATLLLNGKVLIAGGSSGNNYSLARAQAELYDPATGTFTAAGEMTTARSSHTATLLPNGKVLIAGGYKDNSLAAAELYDPSTGIFSATGSMSGARAWHTATLLPDGKVLMEGSMSDDVAEAEVYDSARAIFILTGRTKHPGAARAATASLLTNGNVLATLEYSCDASEFAEVYAPSAGTFTATGNMTKPRGYSTSTLLPDGRVLVAGRDWVHFGGSADLYDHVAGTFSPTGDTQREEGQTATLLPDGTVLLSGGWMCCGYSIATAEIYHPAVLVPSPVLFSLVGGVQGAILHAGTHQVVSSSNPAVAGEALEVYGSGLIDGSVIPPQAAIGGRMAEVLFFGKAPGYPGFNQVNVRMPGGITPGSAVPVRLTYLGRPSNEVTIAVQ